jgi:hypothetical protein
MKFDDTMVDKEGVRQSRKNSRLILKEELQDLAQVVTRDLKERKLAD